MATSGVYSLAVSRDDIIRHAMLEIGKLDPYESPDPIQLQDCALRLNMFIKTIQGKADYAPGLKVWTRKHGHLFLSNSTGRYLVGPGATGWTNDYVQTNATAAVAAAGVSITLDSVTGVASGYNIGIEQTDGSLFWTTISALVGSVATIGAMTVGCDAGAVVYVYQTTAQQPIVIESVVLRDIDDADTPVGIYRTVQDYDALSTKAQASFLSEPQAIYFETQLTNSYIYTDCGATNDVTKHLAITYMEPMQVFTTTLDGAYFPDEYLLFLSLGLGKLIAPMFNRPWTQTNEDNLTAASAIAKHKDAENTSQYFQCGNEE